MRTKFVKILVGMVAAGVVAYLGIRSGFFPAVIVDGDFVSRSRFETQLKAAIKYTETVAERDSSAGDVNLPALRVELRRAVLDKLVEDTLVAHGVRKKIGSALGTRVKDKLATVQEQIAKDDFKAALSEFYGFGVADFREFVLVPQAERELLEDALKTEKHTAASWIEETRRTASVRILIRGLKWDGLQVANVTK
jgi:hypothetical protein